MATPTRYFVQKIQAEPPVFVAVMHRDGLEREELGKRPKVQQAKLLCERSAGRELDWDRVKGSIQTWEAVRD